jgi:hypothetical protein
MAMTPAAPSGVYGISTTFTDYTIESETISNNPLKEVVPDQKNATANEITYDTRVDLRITVRGASEPTATSGVITYNGIKYSLDSCEKAGTYNGLQRYNVTAHRFDNFPE